MKNIFPPMQELAIGLMFVHGEVTPGQLLAEWAKIQGTRDWGSSRRMFGANSAAYKTLYKLEEMKVAFHTKPDGFTYCFRLHPTDVKCDINREVDRIGAERKAKEEKEWQEIYESVQGKPGLVEMLDDLVANAPENLPFHLKINADDATNAFRDLGDTIKKFSVAVNEIAKPMQKARRRRYYVHGKVKKFAKVEARKKLVLIAQNTWDELPAKSRGLLAELTAAGYSVQSEIPQ